MDSFSAVCVPRKYTGLNGKSPDVLRAAKGSYMRFSKVGQSLRVERLIVIMSNVRRIKFIFMRQLVKERRPVVSVGETIKWLWMQNTTYS